METAESWFHDAEKQDPEFVEKGDHNRGLFRPAARIQVICIDELGPLAVKTYPGEEWKLGAERATFEPDYGRRGKLWVHGAFEPATGQATISD